MSEGSSCGEGPGAVDGAPAPLGEPIQRGSKATHRRKAVRTAACHKKILDEVQDVPEDVLTKVEKRAKATASRGASNLEKNKPSTKTQKRKRNRENKRNMAPDVAPPDVAPPGLEEALVDAMDLDRDAAPSCNGDPGDDESSDPSGGGGAASSSSDPDDNESQDTDYVPVSTTPRHSGPADHKICKTRRAAIHRRLDTVRENAWAADSADSEVSNL